MNLSPSSVGEGLSLITLEFGRFFIMAMMTGDRVVVIEVAGGNATLRQTHYTVRTTYSTMSNTIQQITRQGGKILKVTVPGSTPSVSEAPAPVVAAEEPQKKGFKSKKK
jgi:CpcD/allophycocyanin linker domain